MHHEIRTAQKQGAAQEGEGTTLVLVTVRSSSSSSASCCRMDWSCSCKMPRLSRSAVCSVSDAGALGRFISMSAVLCNNSPCQRPLLEG